FFLFFFFQAEDGIRDPLVTGVQTCALPIWLFQSDFLPFAYASHRAAPIRGWFDHVLHPSVFLGSQIFFLLPSLFIAAALFWPREIGRASCRERVEMWGVAGLVQLRESRHA